MFLEAVEGPITEIKRLSQTVHLYPIQFAPGEAGKEHLLERVLSRCAQIEKLSLFAGDVDLQDLSVAKSELILKIFPHSTNA